MRLGSNVLASLAAATCLWLSGCAGEGDPPPAPTTTLDTSTTTVTTLPSVDLAQIQAQIFTPSCGFSGCHNTATHQGNLDLSSAAVSHAELVGVVSECAGKILVVPGDADASYLMHKVGAGPEPCGTLMPQLLPPLSPAQRDMIRSWIEGGALPASVAAPAGDKSDPTPASAAPSSSSSTTSSTLE